MKERMKEMKASLLIVEDERAVAQELKMMIEQLDSELHVLDICEDGESALVSIISYKPDIVFLDIELPGINGMDVANTLAKVKEAPAIVFLTAYQQFALQAFQVNAVDYVLKPISTRKLKQVLERLSHVVSAASHAAPQDESHEIPAKLAVDKGDAMAVIDWKDIRYVCGQNRQVLIHMKNGECHATRMTLRDLEAHLPSQLFFRCHRGYIVNVDEIKEIKTWFKRGIVLKLRGDDDVELPVGRVYMNKLREYIEL